MSMVSAPATSGSRSIQELRYTLQVRRAELAEALKKKGALYVEIKLPNGLQVFIHTVESPKLEWNRTFAFTSPRTVPIRVKLNKRESFRSDVCLGEASISIGELNDRCQGGQDSSLILVSPRSRQTIGNLFLQLHTKTQATRISPDLTGSRRTVEHMRSKIVETLSVEYPDKFTKTVSAPRGFEDPDGFEILNRIRNQLDSMNSGKLKTALGVMEAAAKIHPCVEGSWKIVSSLHGAYQKKPRVDSEVIRIFASMDHVLSFVEDVDKLKDEEQRFFVFIEQSLRIVEDCGSFILRYLNGNTRDRTQFALSSEEKLGYYQNQLRGLAEDLARIVNVHVAHRVEDNHEVMEVLAHRVEDNHNEVVETLERIDSKLPNSQASSIVTFQSIIPPPPTEDFTGRSDYLKTIEASFEFPKTSVEMGKQRKFVLYGTGGMGKTQLALKFLDENRERFTVKYIIDASSNESIAASFINIGRDAGIPSANKHNVLEWLSRKIEDWILIFDNADNRDVKLRPYFPNSRHGNNLITTRNADYESLAPSLEVSILDVSSAVSLLLRTAKLEETEHNREMAQKIVGEFGHLALAIVQAGSYVHTERLTLHEYYERYERSRSTLLKSGPLKEELAYERPVYATWEISYAALSRFAKFVLDLCALLYREEITEELWLRAVASKKVKLATENEEDDPTEPKQLLSFIRYLRLDEANDDTYEYDVRFREIVRELRSYSLIQELFRGSFSIHPLVHSWARERMKPSHRLEAQTNATHLLHYSLKESVYELYLDSGFTRTIIPHIESCGQPLRADIAVKFAGVYAACQREGDPQTRGLLSMELIYSKQFEVNNQTTYDSRDRLGELYRWLCRYSEATQILQPLLEEKRRVLGNDHRSTLHSMHELAMTYRYQGQSDDAQELLAEVIEARRRVLGNDHPSTLDSMYELASTYQDRGRLDDAQELFVEVIDVMKRVFSNDHSLTLSSMHCLALTYRDQGRLNDAQELFAEVIETGKRVLGDDHSDTLSTMHCLALTYRDQGRFNDAQDLFAKVIEARKRVHGNDHYSTLLSMHCLASTYRDQGRLVDAQELFVEVIEVEKRVLGNDHSSTLLSMHELAMTYRYQGQSDDAQELFAEVIEACEQVLGNDHPSTLDSMHELALTYRDRGRLNDAQELLVQVIKVRERVLGSDDPLTLVSMYELASTYLDQSYFADAEELGIESYERHKRVFGLSDYRTVLSRKLLIKIHTRHGRLGDAGRLEALNSNHPRTGR